MTLKDSPTFQRLFMVSFSLGVVSLFVYSIVETMQHTGIIGGCPDTSVPWGLLIVSLTLIVPPVFGIRNASTIVMGVISVFRRPTSNTPVIVEEEEHTADSHPSITHTHDSGA